MRLKIRHIALLIFVVVVSGCTHTSQNSTSDNNSQNINTSTTPHYSEDQVQNTRLNFSDLQELDFYSEIDDYQTYRRGWSKPILLDDYAGTKPDKKGFKLYDKDQELPDFGQSDVPIVIETAVYRFENPGSAIKNMKEIIEGSDDLGSSKTVSEDGTYYSRQVKVHSGTGLKVTARYERIGNILLVAATANYKNYTVEQTDQLIAKMRQKLKS